MNPMTPADLKKIFHESQDRLRLLALLSPTCLECRRGHQVMKEVLEAAPSAALKPIFVWIPMLETDSVEAAEAQAASFPDPRLTQGWDADRAIGALYQQMLHLTRTAWDAYLLYAPGVAWEGDDPPPPTFWMHQLAPDSGADPSLCLERGRFGGEIACRLKFAGI